MARQPGDRGGEGQHRKCVSLDGFAISTANLYAGTLPGGALFGLALSAPPNPAVLYSGDPSQFGSASDPFVGKSLGGVISFGGGLALYDGRGVAGALGASGDTSCADHNIAWRVRHALGLDKVPAGVGPDHDDEIIYDLAPTKRAPPAMATLCARARKPRSPSRFMPASCPAGRRISGSS